MNYTYTVIIPHKSIPELLKRCLDSLPERDDLQVTSLQIIHLEDMSTNFSHNKTREKMLFQNRQKARSLKVILEFMKANENNGV